MKNRDLVIIGGYPSDENRISVLKETILSLNSHFDILLCTHYPADVELQKLVNYYVYDDRNEFFENDSVYMWAVCPDFYFEYYYGENGWKHHSYAIYKSILNGVSFAQNYYDDFYYLEGDSIFSESDIQKIKDIKSITSNSNKDALFFCVGEHIQTIFFYSKINFFNDTFPKCKNVQEYKDEYQKINSFGVLENFFYRTLQSKNKLQSIVMFDETEESLNYFSSSKINVNFFKEDNLNSIPFELKIAKVRGSEDLAYLCISSPNVDLEKNRLDLYVDDEYIDTLPGVDFYTSKRIYPKNEIFNIRLGDSYVRTYTKTEILRSKTFVEFK